MVEASSHSYDIKREAKQGKRETSKVSCLERLILKRLKQQRGEVQETT